MARRKSTPPQDGQDQVNSAIEAIFEKAREEGERLAAAQLQRVAEEWVAAHPETYNALDGERPWTTLSFSMNGMYRFGFFIDKVAVTDTEDDDVEDLRELVRASRWCVDDLDPLGVVPAAFDITRRPSGPAPRSRSRR